MQAPKKVEVVIKRNEIQIQGMRGIVVQQFILVCPLRGFLRILAAKSSRKDGKAMSTHQQWQK